MLWSRSKAYIIILAINGITGFASVAPDKLLTPHNTITAVTHEIRRMDIPVQLVATDPLKHMERARLES